MARVVANMAWRLSPTVSPPIAWPSKPSETMWAALRSRSSRSIPPWTIPKTSWPGAGSEARQRPAHSDVRRTASSSFARSTPAGGHSSNAMAMSDPSRRWISIASSGVNRCREPS